MLFPRIDRSQFLTTRRVAQDSENNTILIILADLAPSPTSSYAKTDPDFMDATLRMARLYYDRYPFILDWSNSQGRTALHTAALKGNEELVRVRILQNHFPVSSNNSAYRCYVILKQMLICQTTRAIPLYISTFGLCLDFFLRN